MPSHNQILHTLLLTKGQCELIVYALNQAGFKHTPKVKKIREKIQLEQKRIAALQK